MKGIVFRDLHMSIKVYRNYIFFTFVNYKVYVQLSGHILNLNTVNYNFLFKVGTYMYQ